MLMFGAQLLVVSRIALMAKNRSKNPKRRMNLIVAPLALLDQYELTFNFADLILTRFSRRWQLEIEIKTDCGFSCYIHHGSVLVQSICVTELESRGLYRARKIEKQI
jgi:hypothetical protein